MSEEQFSVLRNELRDIRHAVDANTRETVRLREAVEAGKSKRMRHRHWRDFVTGISAGRVDERLTGIVRRAGNDG